MVGQHAAQKLLASASEMFYFEVTMKFQFNYTITQSKSYKEVKEAINTEINNRMETFSQAVSIVNNIMFVTFAFVAIKAFIYRYRWLTDDRYDNIYVTFTVLDLEERRTINNKKGIMPLLLEEQLRYVESLDWRMVVGEVRRLAAGLVFFLLSVFNAAFYLFCDYGLYSVLALINKHFKVVENVPSPPHTKLNVVGKGPMADMYRSMVTMFDPVSSSNVKMDVTQCVPNPSEPNWNVYRQIGIIYFVCLILLITEAYGLRLRHIIMACYYPRRDRMRALWLFNHIMKTRGPLMDHVKNRLKKEKGALNVANISVKGRLAASFPILERLFKFCGWEVKNCLYCGMEGKPDDYTKFIHCAFGDCDGVYCVDCYADLDNVCAVCNNAVELTASASEELDSSLSEMDMKVKKIQKKVRDRKIRLLQQSRRPSTVIEDFRSTVGYREGDTLEEVLGDSPNAQSSSNDSSEASKTSDEGVSSKSSNSKSSMVGSEHDYAILQDETTASGLIIDRNRYNDSTISSLSDDHIMLIEESGSESLDDVNESIDLIENDGNVDYDHEMSYDDVEDAIDTDYDNDDATGTADNGDSDDDGDDDDDADADVDAETDDDDNTRLLQCNKQSNALRYRPRIPYAEKLNQPRLLRQRLNIVTRNKSRNAIRFMQSKVDNDSDTDADEVSSVSSVDTADLDFEYQTREYMHSDYSSDEGATQRRSSKSLDLATYDIFGSDGMDTDSDADNDDDSSISEVMEPVEIVISRE